MKKPKAKRKQKGQSRKTRDDLFEQLIKMTGIPAATLKRELKAILERKNIDIHQLTIEDLRGVVAAYLREIMSGILDKCGHRRNETSH